MNTQNRYENFKEHYVEELKFILPQHLEYINLKKIDIFVDTDDEELTKDILHIVGDDNEDFLFNLDAMYKMFQKEGALEVQDEIIERLRYEHFKNVLAKKLNEFLPLIFKEYDFSICKEDITICNTLQQVEVLRITGDSRVFPSFGLGMLYVDYEYDDDCSYMLKDILDFINQNVPDKKCIPANSTIKVGA